MAIVVALSLSSNFSAAKRKPGARNGRGHTVVRIPDRLIPAPSADVQDRARKHVRAKPQRFTVVSKQTVHVDMDIDTGIR
jgi:hypothetical protein